MSPVYAAEQGREAEVIYLQLILMVCVSVRQMPEFLGQSETVLYMFWRYKVFCYFYATVQIVYLGGKKYKRKTLGIRESIMSVIKLKKKFF